MKQPTVVRIIGRFCGMFALSLLALGLVAWALIGQTGAVQGHSGGASSHTLPGAVRTSPTGSQARTLFYQVVPTYLTKEFVGDPVPAGSPVALRFTITNFDRFTAMTGIAFTDDLASTLPGLVAAGLPATDLCGTGSALSGTSLLSFSGGTLEPEATCTFTVTLQVPALTAAGSYTNTTGALTADLGGPVSFAAATDILLVNDAPFLAKRFSDDPVTPGAEVTLEFAITNTSSFSATDIGFSDNLNAVLAGLTAVTLPSPGFCGAASTLSGASTLAMISGELAPHASCVFSVTLQVPANALGGIFANVTAAIIATVNGESRQGNAATDTLTVVRPPVLTKNFMNDPVAAGGAVILEFVLTYGEEAAVAANIAFSDDLAATLPGLVATGLPRTDLCGAGSQLSSGSTVSFTGGVLAPGSTCIMTVTLQVPVTSTAGIYANTTSTVTADVLGMAVAGSPATDSLRIIELAADKLFLDGPAVAGGELTLQFTLSNTSQISTTANISFTDDLSAALAGLASVSGALADICGAGSSLSGTTLLTFSGGTLPPVSACTFTVTLAVPAAAANGEYLNRTGSIDFTVEGIPAAAKPAEEIFAVVPALALAKSFLDDPVAPGGAVTLAFTVTNVDSSRTVTDIAFSDDLGAVQAGLQAIAWPAGGFCGAGSQLAGASTLAFTGGTLAPGASCTFTATIQAPPALAANSAVNTTSAVTGLIDGAAVTGDAAQDTLTFQTALLTKRFTPGAAPGQTVLTFTLQNLASGSDFYSLSFVDDLSAMLAGATATDLPKSDVCGPGSTLLGNAALSLNNANLAAGAGCTFSVTVEIPGGVAPGIYTNTTSAIYESGQAAGAPAEATLIVVPPDFTKQFSPAMILAGGVSTLTFTIDNSAGVLSAANLIFTDTLPAGLVIAAPANAVTSCSGGTLAAAPGAGAVSYAGGALAANSTCTVTVAVAGAAGGTYTNTTSSLASSLGSSAKAGATLVVALCAATPDDGATVFGSVDAQAVQSAINAAAAGATVKVVGNCTGVENAGGSDQTGYIATALTLRGGYTLGGWSTSDPLVHPTTLDAALGGRVLRIDGVPVEVANLTVQHGQVAGDGGGILSTGALTLTNVQVLSSSAAAAGGGVYVAGVVAATDSRFAANGAGADGGGLFALAASTVNNSQFVSNTAIGNGGGMRGVQAATVAETTFLSNTAAAAGGAVFDSGSTLVNSSFTGNATGAAGNAGGGYFNGSAVLTNVTFTHNIAGTAGGGGGVFANSATVNGGEFNGNRAGFAGGGAYFNGAAVVTKAGFTNNTATLNRGGGAYFNDTAVLSATTFAGNAAGADRGGGAYFRAAANLSATSFVSNTAANRAGGAYFFATATLTNANFIGNTGTQRAGGAYFSGATTVNGGLFQANRCTGSCLGGGLFTSGALLLNGVAILGNTADGQGGGAYLEGGASMVNSTIAQNHSGANGGGIANAGGAVTIVAGTVSSNTADSDGGGIFNTGAGSAVTVTAGSLVQANSAQFGGGIANENAARFTLSAASMIRANVAISYGGGIINGGAGLVTIDASTLIANHAVQGGALQNNYPGSAVTIANGALLQSNLATDYGGAIFNGFGSTIAIDASSLLSNTAAQGGGLHNQDEGSVVTIATASRLQANAGLGADSVGGAISNVLTGTVVITGSTLLLANQADFGGALFVTLGGTVAVNASHIQANTAITSGGGIYNNVTGRVAIDRSLLEGNTAQEGYGGAVRNFGQVTVSSSRLLSNTAPNGFGGAITTGDGQGSALAVSHSTLQHNSAGAGGALYQLGGISTVTANCVVDNSDTAVIYAAGASPLAATGNWWGHPSGPAGAGPGVGDSVSSNVDFSGFTTAAILGCPTFGNPELAIVKTASPALIVPGQNVTYVLTFGNSGQRFAHNVVISDSVPVSVTITGVASSGAVISQTGGSPNFAWSAGDLAIGAGGAITLTGTVNNNITVAGTVITNTAAIAGAGDVTLANNTGSAGVAVKPAFTVGGAVSGLAGSGLVLQNNGGDNLGPAVNGPFTFATPLLDGSAYAVSVLVQPANPPQICVVNNGDGVLAGTHASNVQVVCTTGSYPLTTVTDGAGSGALTLDPAGGTYSHGAVVTVTAIPAAGSAFAGWSGACSGTGGCAVTMDAAKIVTATFDLLLPSFDVSIDRRNNDPVLPGDTVLWDVTITNTGPITATVNEISATLTVVLPPVVAAGGGEPAPCAPPVTLAVAEIHRCTLSLVIPVASAVELTLTVSGEGANGAPASTTVTAGLTLVPPTGLEAIEEPLVGPKLFLPLIGR